MKQKEQQKKDIVLAVISELESQGLRINADLVAQKANMGKQTILPYYNEWRFLQKMGQYQQEDLPEELVSAIKQQMGKWKYQYEAKHLDYEDNLKQEVNHIEDKLQQSCADTDKLQHEVELQNLTIGQYQEQVDQLSNKAQDLEKLVFELHTKLDTEKKQISKLENESIKLQQQHQAQIIKLETKLEAQHQGQIDHWIKITDHEKSERNKLEKKLTNTQDEIEQLRAKNLQLTNKGSRLKSLIDEGDTLISENNNTINELKNKLLTLEKVSILLDCSIEEVPNKVRQFIKYEAEVNHYKDYNKSLLQQVDKLHNQKQHKNDSYKLKKAETISKD
jgi:chromosome segregation ATPase